MHKRHVQAIYRPLRPDGRFEPAKEPDNSDLAPVVALSGAQGLLKHRAHIAELTAHAAGVLVSLCAYQANRQQLQPAKLRRIPVVGPWLVRALRHLSESRQQPGEARRRAGQAAVGRVRSQRRRSHGGRAAAEAALPCRHRRRHSRPSESSHRRRPRAPSTRRRTARSASDDAGLDCDCVLLSVSFLSLFCLKTSCSALRSVYSLSAAVTPQTARHPGSDSCEQLPACPAAAPAA